MLLNYRNSIIFCHSYWMWYVIYFWEYYIMLKVLKDDSSHIYILSLIGASYWTLKRNTVCVESCPTLCDPIDCSLPGYSVHGSFTGKNIEWVVISFSRGTPPIRGLNPCVLCLLHWQADSLLFSWVQFSPITQSCPTLCKPVDCSMPRLLVHHQFPEFTQTHVHWVSDAVQPSHPLLSPSPSAFNFSQHQGLFKWVSTLHQVAKVLEFQLQHQSFQWIFRTDFL